MSSTNNIDWDKAIEELGKKLKKSNVKPKPYSNNCEYIEAWHAIAEANRIFGFNNWSMETVYNKEVCKYDTEVGKSKEKGFCVGYEAKVKVVVDGVVREGTGHGSGIAKDLFTCIEGASKEAESDAMKRALRSFGNQFGLALYDKTRRNVTNEEEPLTDVFKAQVDEMTDLDQLRAEYGKKRPSNEKKYIKDQADKIIAEKGE